MIITFLVHHYRERQEIQCTLLLPRVRAQEATCQKRASELFFSLEMHANCLETELPMCLYTHGRAALAQSCADKCGTTFLAVRRHSRAHCSFFSGRFQGRFRRASGHDQVHITMPKRSAGVEDKVKRPGEGQNERAIRRVTALACSRCIRHHISESPLARPRF